MVNEGNLGRRIRVRAARQDRSSTGGQRVAIPVDPASRAFETERPTDYLIRAARTPAAKAYKSLAVERLAAEEGSAILDLGCGTGGELGPLLSSIGPAGSVTGVDIDADALDVARRSHTDPRLRLVIGDAHALGLDDNSVDRVYVDRTMQHLAAPSTVLDEVRRILRPGGRVVLAEPDWRTLVIDHPEPDIALAYQRFILDHVVRNARIGSELPRLVRQAEFELESVTPVTGSYTDPFEADRVFGFARVTRRAVRANCLDPDQADRWLQGLRGPVFFASMTIFVTAARHGVRSGRHRVG